jgi:hypothetical protein
MAIEEPILKTNFLRGSNPVYGVLDNLSGTNQNSYVLSTPRLLFQVPMSERIHVVAPIARAAVAVHTAEKTDRDRPRRGGTYEYR